MSSIEIAPAFAAIRPKRASISAILTKADGTVIDLGEIAATDFDEHGQPIINTPNEGN